MTELQINEPCSASAVQPAKELSDVHCGEFHVLAVDDSTSDRRIVEKLLKRQSYKVTTAKNAIHALQILGLEDRKEDSDAENKFNLIITDYSMPGMNGGELLRRVKDAASLSNIPVVIMSSEDISSRKKKCLDEGAEDYLIKPLRVNDILKINCLVKKSKQIVGTECLGVELPPMSVGILLSGSQEQRDKEDSSATFSIPLESKNIKFGEKREFEREIEQVCCTEEIPKRSRLMRYTTI